MSRKNIFDIVGWSCNPEKEVSRLKILLNDEDGIYHYNFDYLDFNSYTIINYVDKFLFKKWKNKGTTISCQDFFESIFPGGILSYDVEHFLLYCEYAANIAYLAKSKLLNGDKTGDAVITIIDNVKAIVSHYGYELKYFAKEEKALIVMKSAQATSVAEYLSSELSSLVLEYNHFTLKGNISRKRGILFALGKAIEPLRKEIREINYPLETNIFQMLNNMNIRHNNTQPGNKNYNKYVAGLAKNELEQWYDDLYQMILLAYMLKENKERDGRVKILIQALSAKEQNDGQAEHED